MNLLGKRKEKRERKFQFYAFRNAIDSFGEYTDPFGKQFIRQCIFQNVFAPFGLSFSASTLFAIPFDDQLEEDGFCIERTERIVEAIAIIAINVCIEAMDVIGFLVLGDDGMTIWVLQFE